MASFWDDLKDLFKTKSEREEERQQRIKDALASEGGVVEELKDLELEFQASRPQKPATDINELFPEDSGLKEIEYKPASDEELSSLAGKETEYEKQTAQNKLTENFESALEKLAGSRENAKKNLSESYKQLDELYKSLRERTENDTLKRGLARSSIVLSQLDNLDAAHVNSAAEVESAYNEMVNAIDAEANKLKAEKDRALGELDLRYASELDKKLADLKEERASTVAQYEKYNNKIREQQKEYARNREEDISDYLKEQEAKRRQEEEETRAYEKKYGYSGEKLENYNKRYEIAYDFYMSLSPDIAADALAASPNMRYYLGNNYEKLKGALEKRSANNAKYY